METLELLASLAAAGTPCVLATVVSCEAPTSARPGDKAVIAEDGSLTGWIGGGCSEPAVRQEALRALADGRPRVLRLTATAVEEPRQPGRVTMATTCPSGGSLEILIDPQLPRPVLLVFGETPAAETMARLAELVGFRARTVARTELGSLGVPGADAWAVVCTMGHYDEEALAAALAHPALDVALVASGRRARSVLEGLRERGFEEAALARVRTPAGGARGASQEEIALAAVAEIAALRRQRRQPAVASGPAGFATDPVCGMAVEVAGAVHVASHRRRDYYFCCADCRRQFAADPERFLATIQAAVG
ncbi:MAG TPA: XdhC family protein [Candidatus Dormibacteraeota bacterium]